MIKEIFVVLADTVCRSCRPMTTVDIELVGLGGLDCGQQMELVAFVGFWLVI